MNRYIPDEIIETIQSRCDIVELINSFLPLKKNGPGRWQACCPFHEEKTPSFKVDAQKQRFHCYGCGKGGNVFRFIMERENVDFPNAVHLLAARCGVVIPEKTYKNPAQRQAAVARADQRQRIYAINELFANWFAANLKNHPSSEVAQYLNGRRLSPEIITTFGLGAAPDGWDNCLKYGLANGFSREELLEAGILTQNAQGRIYDRFRNRLMFPIWNEQDKVVAFSARTIAAESQGAKYVNSPETPVFRKSSILYGLSKARVGINKHHSAIICEGQLDVIAMHRAGFNNTVAPQGTAFTDEQARILKRYTDCLYIAFDSDNAGRKATLRALELTLPLGFELRIIQFPPQQDPDSIYAASGAEKLQELVNNAEDFFDFLLHTMQESFDTTSPMGKSKMITELLGYLRRLPAQITRELYLNQMSERLKIDINTLRKELNDANQRPRQYQRVQPKSATDQTASAANNKAVPPLLEQAEETLLRIALVDENAALQLAAELPVEHITKSPLGMALNELIRLAMSGEWDQSMSQLAKIEIEHPSPKLSEILLDASLQLNDKEKNKALTDCVNAIKGYHVQNSRAELLQRLRQAQSKEEKEQILKTLQNL